MKTGTTPARTLKWALIYAALLAGLLWLHDPFQISMDAASSTVTFVYQQF
ncbi:MAG: hypothetical protein IT230_05990 [Flavobacteriales bacterium]|nr:hypothetical protein [Flavobacteriales bacterium]